MTRPPIVACLLLGSNLGDRAALLAGARTQLAEATGQLLAVSAIYETAAWGREDQPAFLNQAVAVHTLLPADDLLKHCLRIEQLAGRQRQEHWGSRTLDVDILLYGSEVIALPGLHVPHPQLAARRFALLPLAEIAGQQLVPPQQVTVSELLARCPDPLPVRRWY